MRAVTNGAILMGIAFGGAVVLAAACDLRVAASSTRFAIPEVDLGIPLAWGGIPTRARDRTRDHEGARDDVRAWPRRPGSAS